MYGRGGVIAINGAATETGSSAVFYFGTYNAPVHSAEQKAIGAVVKIDFFYQKKYTARLSPES
jgi:hypothetical protein